MLEYLKGKKEIRSRTMNARGIFLNGITFHSKIKTTQAKGSDYLINGYKLHF